MKRGASRGMLGLALIGLLVASCASNDSSESGGLALDESRMVSTLSPAEQGELCDWHNAQLGGYGKSTQCGATVTTLTEPSQTSCVTARGPLLMQCQQTVGAYKACLLRVAKSPCDVNGALDSAVCQFVKSCLV